MDFASDDVREQANRKKHGLDFRTAAKVFSDPHVIEFENTLAVVRIISARGAEPHEKRKYHEL